MPALIVNRAAGLLRLTLNRPEVQNALDDELVLALTEALTKVEEGVRVIAIDGGPGRFCAGLDLKMLTNLDRPGRLAFIDHVRACFQAILDSPQPVIAAIDGPALAGGFDLAVMADLRLATAKAHFGQPEINLGFSMLLDPLWKIVGLGRAKELALTGRVYGAREAYEMGLVNRVCLTTAELEQAVRSTAREMAAKDPEALAETKRLARVIPGLPFEQALEEQIKVFRRLMVRPGAMERARVKLSSHFR